MSVLKGYINKAANNNRIFTAEDIGAMSKKEFVENEKAIDYQTSTIGIPRKSDLSGNSDVVFVNSYTKSDGTEVRAHYRSKPDGGAQTSNGDYSGSTGGAAGVEENGLLKGGVTYNDYQTGERSTIDDYLQEITGITIEGIEKFLLGAGVNALGKLTKQNDAVAMWQMAANSEGFYNNDYANKNGTIYNGADELGNEFNPYKNIIKEKVKSQFGDKNVPGVVFRENSSVSKIICQSQELKDFVNKNEAALNAGKNVTGSFGFNSDQNQHNAFGKVDVLSAELKDGYVDVKILDTYDFNKGDSNPIIKMGHSAQETGKLNPYFTIVKCRYKLK